MTDVWRPTLDDFVEAAAVILDAEPEEIARLPGVPLADSALQAPFAGIGEADAYPSLLDKATVLIERLALFLERNGHRWGDPDHDRDVAMVEHIAGGDANEDGIRDWIKDRTR